MRLASPWDCDDVPDGGKHRDSGANAATPQNPGSSSDDSKPQHDAHRADSVCIETMPGERHVCRATSLVECERENTVEHDDHADHEQRRRRQEATGLHRADATVLAHAEHACLQCPRMPSLSRREVA